MKSLASYLITFFVVLFWVFRMIVALTATLEMDFFIQPINFTYEIIMLFVTLVAIVLIVKRNIIGALIYFSSTLLYYGADTYQRIVAISGNAVAGSEYMNIFVSCIAIVLSIAVLLDILLNKDRLNEGGNKKTDWYYKNEAYDRKLDERADKNNYRTM